MNLSRRPAFEVRVGVSIIVGGVNLRLWTSWKQDSLRQHSLIGIDGPWVQALPSIVGGKAFPFAAVCNPIAAFTSAHVAVKQDCFQCRVGLPFQ